MFKIINKLILGKDIKRLDVEAPDIVHRFNPGQFVMVCPEKGYESIPLAIVDSDQRRNLISLIFKERGKASRRLGALPIHEEIFSISGPFGTSREPQQVGVVVCVASDVSAAQLFPMCRAYNRAGNKVIGVLGAQTKSELILEPQMRIVCHRLLLCTKDGTYQRRGTVMEIVKEIFDQENVSLVYSIGDTSMVREIAAMTKERAIPNLIQIHTLMACGRGICGSCRVKVNEQVVLGCADGPEFDAHQIDFDYLKHRMDQCQCHKEAELVEAKGIFKRLFNGDE